MHNSKISDDMLGPFHTPDSSLQVGMDQCMQYVQGDIGPCYLNEREREKCISMTSLKVKKELMISTR